MIARQCHATAARIPYRHRKGAAKYRPDVVSQFLPGGQKQTRVRPLRRLQRRNSGTSKQIVAIVQPQIRGDDRSARVLIRLTVEAVFRRHSHQCVRETAVILCNDLDAVRPILIERIGGPFEIAPRDAAAIETDESGDSAHQRAPPNWAKGVKRPTSRSMMTPPS